MSSDPHNSNSSNGMPPANNPVLSAYEGFVQKTPLVTRYVMSTLLITCLLSIFIDGLAFSLSNIPYFSLGKLELYRIIISPLICNNLISLAFAYFSFLDHGKRLEYSMGSAQFAYLFFLLGMGINVAHIVLTYTLQLITADSSWIFVKASGIWTVLFPLIAIECVQAPSHSIRKLFMWQVPTLYYPLILAGLFSLLGGYSVANWLALATGYAYGYGYLDFAKVSSARVKQWEETILANFARREGWVVGHAATGSDAWNDMITAGAASSPQVSSASFFRDWCS